MTDLTLTVRAAKWAASIKRSHTPAQCAQIILDRRAAAVECKRRAATLKGLARRTWTADAAMNEAFTAALSA